MLCKCHLVVKDAIFIICQVLWMLIIELLLNQQRISLCSAWESLPAFAWRAPSDLIEPEKVLLVSTVDFPNQLSLRYPCTDWGSLSSPLPGGYDGNDVEFSWLRGNDSVRGLENLRLAQYTIQQYFTLVTVSQQETGNSYDPSHGIKTP